MLANALKQLTTLKSGYPAPSAGLLENAAVWYPQKFYSETGFLSSENLDKDMN
jgi:hypothetical protein